MAHLMAKAKDDRRRTLFAWLTGGDDDVKVTIVKSGGMPCLI
jgi:hypothetical protein